MRFVLSVCLLVFGALPTSFAMDNTLLGGSMKQHIEVWAAPRFSLESGFIYQVAVDLRLDQSVWVGFNHFAGYRNVHYEVDLYKKLSDVTDADDLPNAAIMPLDVLLALEKSLPVSYLPPEYFPDNKFSDEFIEPLKRDGNYLGVPIYDGGQLLLYYNKALLSKAPTTWEEIAELSDRAGTDGVQNLTLPITDSKFFCAIVGCENDMSETDLSIKLTRYKTFINKANVRKQCETSCPAEAELEYCKSTCSRNAFLKGEAYMMVDGDWAITEAKLNLQDNVGITRLPNPLAGKQKQIRYPTVLVFFEDATSGSRKNTTKQLIRFFMKKMNQRSGYFVAGLYPVHKKVRKNIFSRAKSKNDLSSLNVQFSDSSELYNAGYEGWHPSHPLINSFLEDIFVNEIRSIDRGAVEIHKHMFD